MRESDLLGDAERAEQGEFPSRWVQDDQVLGLAYRFEPGAADDGVSVVVPLALLQQVRNVGFDWQVPGLRAELITALLRALPKPIRRHVVPAADWAEKFGAELAGEGPEHHSGVPQVSLKEALARRIQPLANQPVSAADFDEGRVPGHLRMNFRAVDERGKAAGSGRELRQLQASLSDRARASVAKHMSRPVTPRLGKAPQPGKPPAGFPEHTDLTAWTFGALPEQVDTTVAGGVVRGYPAVVDAGSSVSVRVEATAEVATAATRDGVLRLVLLAVPSPASYVQEHLTSPEKLALAASPYPNVSALVEDTRAAVVRDLIDAHTGGTGIVRTAEAFAALRDAVSAALVDRLFAAVSLVARILTQTREVERALKAQNSLALLGPLGDIRTQLSGLVYRGFISATGTARLAHLPRYLQGIADRLQTLANDPGKDRTRMTEFERAMQVFTEAGGSIPLAADAPARLVETRWMLEEFRISVFAQRLGTAQPVSLPRIRKALAAP